MTEQEIEQIETQSRLEVYLKYLLFGKPNLTELFKTSLDNKFITLDGQKFKVKAVS